MSTPKRVNELKELHVHSRGCHPNQARFTVDKVCGFFGRGLEGEYRDDPGILKYLHIPPSLEVNYDLTIKHELDEKRDSGMDLNHFYEWIMKCNKDRSGNLCPPEVKFVVGRSMFQQLLETWYTKNDGWFLRAVKLRGTIYLYVETESVKVAEQNALQHILDSKPNWRKDSSGDSESDEKDEELISLDDDDIDQINDHINEALSFENSDMFSRFGSKFEQYLTSNCPDETPDPTQPLRSYDDFSCMVRARVGDKTLMYAGEMDAMLFDKNLDINKLTKAQFVELKTVNENGNPYSFKRFKLLKAWAQCLLANCNWLLLGHRDDTAGVVKRLEWIRVNQIPHNVNGLWEPENCLKFAYTLLCHIETLLDTESEGTEFRFEFRPTKYGRKVRSFKHDKPSNFLPEDYVKWVKSFPEPKEVYVPPHRRNKTVVTTRKTWVRGQKF